MPLYEEIPEKKLAEKVMILQNEVDNNNNKNNVFLNEKRDYAIL